MKRYTVGDVMTTDVVTIHDTCGYKEIVETLADHGFSAVPVVDSDRRVIGVVSEADLLHKMEFPGGDPHARLLERKHVRVAREKAGADEAAHLMTAPRSSSSRTPRSRPRRSSWTPSASSGCRSSTTPVASLAWYRARTY